ncbi:4-vinyl reductase [Dokdonella sp.]|uniref:4-vinyl reductase n=1 Tax=Dokdonella sp. TaxID=2291710 RepID=UPI001B2675E0|nr:4-vinyl reductase [Dokdonella sp.]MBO9661680.1 4-vinyl reductase [Dokdonella sp.]
MADIEFRVVSDRREGLLLELGRLIVASGFTLQRQRMTRGDEGVVLTMVVRGPEQNLLALEDRLGSHPIVQSFEATSVDASAAATAAAAPPPEPARPRTLMSDARPETTAAAPDPGRVEALLGALAREYPDVFNRVLAFEHEIAPAHREASTRYAGTRLGAWIYKRDFTLGARLNLSDSVKHIALPAMRQLLRGTELDGEALRIKNSPFTGIGLHRGASCHFLRGCLEGLLNEPGHLGRPRILETSCRNTGADACVFTFAA